MVYLIHAPRKFQQVAIFFTMNIEIIKGVCLYNLGQSYYVPKPQALASVGLCELSYTTILNQQKASKWLQNKGFSSTQPKEIPSLGNCHFCEMFSLESWISLLECLSTFRQNSKLESDRNAQYIGSISTATSTHSKPIKRSSVNQFAKFSKGNRLFFAERSAKVDR